ncbi:Pentatricopeptide repeat superfamily protein [Hibiscus syriacus]|uniref:Pentatricopeptide repeat superfamily protein n=1 Tax=Hibiscus syriacus TaxID=106335 RepID=A0A6A3CTU5_HIBSY|nr:uncharacterized protein LOC120133879 [Hibiscus syriacus]KAE8732700.1 Pentatricopeptide repeat superfamily protein [Hibiscus syriacus]
MAKEEEFQESEVIFSDLGSHYDEKADDWYCMSSKNEHLSFNYYKKSEKKMAASSLPVNTSRRRHRNTDFYYDSEADDLEEEDERGELVPPHVIVERRIDGEMAFSVCTGNGRTLKGRDLSRVRDLILRLTGFLES